MSAEDLLHEDRRLTNQLRFILRPINAKTAISILSVITLVISLIYLLGWDPECCTTIIAFCELRKGGSIATAFTTDTVYYDFVHSVHKTREIDVMNVEKGVLILSKIYFSQLGAGVPSAPSEVGGSGGGEAFGLYYFDASSTLGRTIEFSWTGWTHARAGGGGFWLSASECVSGGFMSSG